MHIYLHLSYHCFKLNQTKKLLKNSIQTYIDALKQFFFSYKVSRISLLKAV